MREPEASLWHHHLAHAAFSAPAAPGSFPPAPPLAEEYLRPSAPSAPLHPPPWERLIGGDALAGRLALGCCGWGCAEADGLLHTPRRASAVLNTSGSFIKRTEACLLKERVAGSSITPARA